MSEGTNVIPGVVQRLPLLPRHEKRTRGNGVKRKTLMVREDLADRLSAMAKQQDRSLYDLVNTIVELAIHTEEAGMVLCGVVKTATVLHAARATGFILGLEALWYETADLAYEKAPEETVTCWRDAGAWLAKRYLVGAAANPFAAFATDMVAFTWNAPEFIVDEAATTVSLRVTSPRFSDAYTRLYAAFLDGAVTAFGYQITDRDVSRGTIRLVGTNAQ